MENPDRGFSEIVDIVKSWIPRRTEPRNVSRDFWMPDHSCRVCYECDVQFTIFNRRHHCRHCGRVFCAKCTANSVPVFYEDCKRGQEEVERIRVCNYCFKQWEQEVAAAAAVVATTADNESRCLSPALSPTPSITSLASTKSCCTVNSSISIGGSMPFSTRPYQRQSYGSGHNGSQPIPVEPDKEEALTPRKNMDSIADIGDPSPSQFGFCLNRSDDDDDYGGCHSDTEGQCFHQPTDYYSRVDFDEVDHDHVPEENKYNKDFTSLVDESTELQGPEGTDKLAEVEQDNVYECDTSSSIYNMEESQETDAEPVDFESNGVLWFPPAPENEEDERDAIMFDEEDGEDATGEFGYLRSSNSFGSGESRSRERSGEEHRKAMKNVLDGHFKALVLQLLQVENLAVGEEGDRESWLEIITSLSWEVASLLKPDTSKGGGMDPAGYVKIKCLASGRRSESLVIKGVVCRKNLAHRRMKSRIEKPRLLILGGALEYQRVSNLLSSFDTLLQQEMDHLKMAVAKIDAHHPNVLLVEKTVSRFAQDYLLAKDISLVLNMKRPLLERIARCTGAQIIPSIDHLSSQKLGHCDLFHVQKFFEEHDSSGKGSNKTMKNLMFFEGCPKPLGCTVLLRGANSDELKRVKHVVQYGVFAAYHLALETSFLADEGASLPELPLKSPITVALPDKPSTIGRSISTIPGFTVPAADSSQLSTGVQKNDQIIVSHPTQISRDISKREMPISEKSTGMSNSIIARGTSAFIQPSADLKGFDYKGFQTEKIDELQRSAPFDCSCQSRTLNCYDATHSKRVRSQDNYTEPSPVNRNGIGFVEYSPESILTNDDQANMNNFLVPNSCEKTLETSLVDENIVRQIRSSEFGVVHQDNIQQEQEATIEEFPPSPSDHQSILVSLSTRCVWKGTVCERAHLFRIKYYGSFDKPLGRFLRDHLFDQGYRCRFCEMPSEAHVHCYTHRQGSLTISVKKLPEFLLPGERDGKIWMWHRCLRCPRKGGMPPETRRVVMSDAAWGLSFGKFLELSFSNHAAASRVASCGHSLHRDCLRFYGFGKMVACFRYTSIDVHSVYLPPAQLDFNTQSQDWIQNEVQEVAEKAKFLFNEVLNSIHQISEKRMNIGLPNDHLNASEPNRCILDLKGILQKEKAEFEEFLRNVLDTDAKKGRLDILEINKLHRQLLFQSYLWDQRLISASGLDNHFHEGLGSLLRQREKLSSIELNSPSKAQQLFRSLDSLPNDVKNDLLMKDDRATMNGSRYQKAEMHQTSRCMENHTSIANANQLVDPLDSGIVVRRALSDGQVPLMSNLSDTLDAKWTGENDHVLDLSKSDSSVTTEDKTVMPDLANLMDSQGKADNSQSFSPAAKVGDGVKKDISRWTEMPFQNFYCSINKISVGNTPLYYMLYEYNPIYISSFRELERQDGARLLLPDGVNGTVVPIFDDEPTSIIAYALVSTDYHSQMADERDRIKYSGDSSISLPSYDSGNFHPLPSFDEIASEAFKSIGSVDDSMLSMLGSKTSALDPLLHTKALHVKVSFTDEGPLGKVKYNVTCYYAKQFEALRRTCCPVELDFIRSLSRCKKWGAQGGKSNVFFAKSLDDRFIIKQVTKTELESFIQFAPQYFKYLSESISTGCPTCLAKILGIYQVTSKHLKGGKESKMDVLVMENLLYGRNVTRLYDLKGSSRSRYNADSSGSNKVLLDQNLIEAMPTSPIFVGNKAKRLLERAVWNDTAFLASIDVMDYSLLVGVDEERHELVLGIIDFMRQYTWDKHLETWVKASGILGGPKNASPTVISPKQYKKRFRKAMAAYFLMVQDQWSPPAIVPSRSQSDLGEDNMQQQLSVE